MIGAIAPWLLAVAMLGFAAELALARAGMAPATFAELTAIAAFLAAAAHLTIGLTRRPLLGLGVPLLAGWWIAALLPSPALALPAAALGGLVAGGALGASAGGDHARCAAVTLLAALLAEALSNAVAGERSLLAASSNALPVALMLVLAALVLALGWWAEGSLAARLLRLASDWDEVAELGLDRRRLWALAAGLGGAAAGLAGAMLAAAGTAPPSAMLGLVLAVAAFAGGIGLLGPTLALTLALWLVPEALAPALADRLDVGLVAATLTTLALAIGLAASAHERRRG